MNPSPSIPEILSPPLSPPAMGLGPQRSIAKTSALKLITSFGDQNSKSKFFSSNDGGQTPIAAGVTPIAESAISPRGEDMSTAFLRPSQRSAFPTPTTARPQGNRGRLPSIGEMPSDNNLRGTARLNARPAPGIESLVPPSDSSSRHGHAHKRSADERNLDVGLALQRAATASPMMMRDSPRRRDPPPPSPGPESQAALLASGRNSRNGPRDRMPNGLELQLQSLDNAVSSDVTSPEQSVSSARFHWPTRRRGPGSITSSSSAAFSAVSATSSNKHHRAHGQKSLDDYISSIEAAKARSRGNSRDGRSKTRDSSQTRNGAAQDQSDDRGRTSSRGYTPKGGKRSPRSPIPMSPEELMNLSIPKYEDEYDAPGTVRKPSTVRAISKSRTRRESSRDEQRRPPSETPRGRSDGRQTSRPRSPSSPVPMSASGIQHFFGSEDEEDYKRAVEEQIRFRAKAARSRDGTRAGSKSREPSPGPVTLAPVSAPRDVSETPRRQEHNRSVEHRVRTPGVRFDSTSHAGDLRAMKDERQLKKEAAARELEERRKSLAKRPMAPPIPHPDELSPALSAMSMSMSIQRAPTAPPPQANYALPSTTFVQSATLPPRSRTAEPEKRSMYAQQPSRPVIGLPATPRAMKLVVETQKPPSPDEPLPPVPTTFAQAVSPLSASNSPQREHPSPDGVAGRGGLLTLLPSTVYQPPQRPMIQRCVSAPPEEPVAPQALQSGGKGMGRLARGNSLRKLTTPDGGGYRWTKNEVMDDNNVGRSSRRPSYDEQIPPPPPPPPMLKELAHLAIPPPPPPAPLPFAQHHAGKPPVIYGGKTSGTIEVIMDTDTDNSTDDQRPHHHVVLPLAHATVPVLSAAPAPPSSRGHHRGRSSVDNSLASRISRATERLRSSSRSRNTNNASVISRTMSPPGTEPVTPYESIGGQQQERGPPVSFLNRDLRSPIDGRPLRDLPTGMGPGDLI